MAKNELDKNLLVKLGAFTIGYFVIVKPLLQWLGLKEDKEDKENNAIIQSVKGWDPSYFSEVKKKGLKTTYITSTQAAKYAKLIFDSFGVINDNEEQIYAVFRSLKNWVQLSEVAFIYRAVYKVDLAYEVKARLSDEEFNNVAKIVAKYTKL